MMDRVVTWSDQMAAGGPAYGRDASALDAREAAKAALADYLRELMQARRRDPGDDLVSKLVHAKVEGGLTDEQIVENARQLLFAGNETTAKWLAQLFLTYGQRPELQRELAADPGLIAAANDEVMRWQGVVGTMGRRVRGGDVELGGVTLRDGERVTCLLAAAGRDPQRYEAPDRLDIHRRREPSLGFGVGLHVCLGINLAKLEAELAVGALLDRVPAFGIAAPYTYSSLPLRGPQPVVIAAAS
jgi:cytochrome P450